MDTAGIIIIVLLLFVGLGVGAYFLFFQTKTCPKVSHGKADPKNNCTITCDKDYTLSSDGKTCSKSSSSCPKDCGDTTCTGGVCTKCKDSNYTLSSDGKSCTKTKK